MNPRATATESTKNDITLSPFDQITRLEEEQENRVRQALEALEAEEREAKKAMEAAQKLEEDTMREQARADLREYAQQEPAAILEESEKETAQDLASIDARFKKARSDAASSLLSSVLDHSFLA